VSQSLNGDCAQTNSSPNRLNHNTDNNFTVAVCNQNNPQQHPTGDAAKNDIPDTHAVDDTNNGATDDSTPYHPSNPPGHDVADAVSDTFGHQPVADAASNDADKRPSALPDGKAVGWAAAWLN
jgi:hypothetical protein